MKKALLAGAVFCCVILVAALYFTAEKPLIRKEKSIQISSVRYRGEEIGTRVDLRELEEILGHYKRKRSMASLPAYEEQDFPVEINVTEGHDPIHILLGKKYLCYSFDGSFVWSIQKGERLLEEVLQLIGAD